MLYHPGMKRMEWTIHQQLIWPGLSNDIENYAKTCHQCQIAKIHKKYGHLPAKDANITPWHTLCLDQIGPYSVTVKNGGLWTLNAMTMVDPATGWFKIIEIPNKKADTAAKLLDQMWFCRYLHPVECIFDNGNEFNGQEFQEMLESYGIKALLTHNCKNPTS